MIIFAYVERLNVGGKMVAVIILVVILLGVICSNCLPIKLSIAQLFFVGALAMVLLGGVSIHRAIASINLTMMRYLFGVFVLAQALQQSAYLERISEQLLKRARTGHHLLAGVVLVMGLGSALLMNDTVAIIGAPLPF